MSRETYRITSPALVLFQENNRHTSHMIPKGAVVTFEGKTFNGDKLVEVLWDGKVVLMFTQDLRSRGEKVEQSERQTSP
jgi:hypothetical protein